jgi:hypothetical protein
MFGANTDEAEERLRSAGHGALSTFDLYRLVRSIQRKEFSFDSKRLAAVLTPSGILQFNDIALAFKTEDTTRVDARSSDGPPGNGG